MTEKEMLRLKKGKMGSYFFFLRYVRTTVSRTIPDSQERSALDRRPKDWVNPATMKVRKDTEATVSA